MSKVPNPGSDEAIDLGCTCARLDNYYGAGFPYPRRDGLDPAEHPSFYVTANCPLHDREHGESMLAKLNLNPTEYPSSYVTTDIKAETQRN